MATIALPSYRDSYQAEKEEEARRKAEEEAELFVMSQQAEANPDAGSEVIEQPYRQSPIDLPDPEVEHQEPDIEPDNDEDDVYTDRFKKYDDFIGSREPTVLPPPPLVQKQDSTHGIIAMIVDAMTNKGRDVPELLMRQNENQQDIDYENWQRQAGAAKQQAAMDTNYANAMKPRYNDNPVRGRQEDRLNAKYLQYNDPNSELNRQQNAYLESIGALTDEIAAMSVQAKINAGVALKKDIEIKMAPQANQVAADRAGMIAEAQIEPKANGARRIVEETTPGKVAQYEQLTPPTVDRAVQIHDATKDARAEAAAKAARDKANTPAERGKRILELQKHAEAASKGYNADTERIQNIGDQMKFIAPFFAKYKEGDTPGFGTLDSFKFDRFQVDEAMEARKRLDLAGEQILRENTGAAAPLSETQINDIRTGKSPGATEEQARLAIRLMAEFTRNNLRAKAVNREEYARDVLRGRGLEEFVYGYATKRKSKPWETEDVNALMSGQAPESQGAAFLGERAARGQRAAAQAPDTELPDPEAAEVEAEAIPEGEPPPGTYRVQLKDGRISKPMPYDKASAIVEQFGGTLMEAE